MISGSIRIDQLSSNIVDFSSALDSFILAEDNELSNDIVDTSNNFYSNILLESSNINYNIDTTSNYLYGIALLEFSNIDNNIYTTSNNLYSHIDTEYIAMSNSIDTTSTSLYSFISLESIGASNSINNTLDIIHTSIGSEFDPLSNSINDTSNTLNTAVLSEYDKLDMDFDVIPVRFNRINTNTFDDLNSLKDTIIDRASNFYNAILISSDGFGQISERRSPGMVSISSNIYIFGGETTSDLVNDFYKIDTNTNTTTPISLNGDTITERDNFGIASYSSNIYIFGGYGNVRFERASNDFYRIDTVANHHVTRLTSDGFGKIDIRFGHNMLNIETDIYIFGGNNALFPNPLSEINEFTEYSNLYKIDTTKESTDPNYSIQLPLDGDNISARYFSGMTKIGTNIYIFGGESMGNVFHNDFYEIDTLTCNVTERSSDGFGKISPRYGHQMISIETDIYIFGGAFRNPNGSITEYNDLYKIDTTTYSVTKISSDGFGKISPRHGHQMISIETDIYIFGGYDDEFNYLNDFYKISTPITYNRVQLYIEETIILSDELASYTLNTGKLLHSQKNITKLNVIYYGLITDNTLTIDANDLPLSITEIEIIVKNNDLRPQFTIMISGFKEILTITIINEREHGGGLTINNPNNVTCIYQNLNNNDIETITIDQVTEHYVLDNAKIKGSPREVKVIVNAILYSSEQQQKGHGLTINFDNLLDSIKIIKIFVKANIYGSGGNGGIVREGVIDNANGVDGGDAIHIAGGDLKSNGKICYIYANNTSLKGGGGGGGGTDNFVARGAYYDESNGEVQPGTGSNGGGNGGAFNSGGGNSGGAAGERVNNGSKATVVLIDEDNTDTPVLNFTGQHRTLVKLTNPMSKYGYIVSATDKYYKRNKNKAIDIIESLPIVELSKTIKDKKVFGVISDKVEVNVKVENNYETSINSVGEGAIWVCDINGNLENGDYITSSIIPGIGMKQDDNLLHNYTVAKITMDCDFNPEYVEVKTLKKDKDSEELIKELVYDNENNLMYEYRYMLRYIRKDGEIIDESTYRLELSNGLEVYKMAFVGCTYHCG